MGAPATLTHVYLDSAATTKAIPEVVAAVEAALTEGYGNPSSLHSKGLEAERVVKQAREAVASVIDARTGEIVFTSGGTEANHLAIKGGARARARRGKHVITTAIEHSSVLSAFDDLEAEGFQRTTVDPGRGGLIDPGDMAAALRSDTVLVSVMAVNNEIGSIQPLQSICNAIRSVNKDVLIHVDGVQAFLKVPLSPAQLGIDLYSMSGHKIHAPKGIGALYVRQGVRIRPLFGGGDQEAGLRAGTENMPGIAGMGAAVTKLQADLSGYHSHLKQIKKVFLHGLEGISNMYINGPEGDEAASDHIMNLSFPGLRGEILMHELSRRGVYVSTGSACSSKKGETSHVLRALSLPKDRLESSIRISFSYLTKEDEARQGANALREAVEKLRSEMGAYM